RARLLLPVFHAAEEFDHDGDGMIDAEDFARIMKQSSLY
ncbi:MAG: hypothetical protein EOO41_03565, partial [Methanobacteriota archaeon]